MNKKRSQDIIQNFSGKRIVVVGDVMLDEYIWGRVNRVSPEAPVIVVDADHQSQVPGGAANVVNNLCALGAQALIVGVVGSDAAGESLTEALKAEGADTSGLIALQERPTTRKTRIIAHSQQVVRVDHEQRAPIAERVIEMLTSVVQELAASADAILLSDYQKGVLTPTLLSACVQAATKRGCPLTGNLKPAALAEHSPLTVLTLNLHEASIAIGGRALHTNSEIEEAGRLLLLKTGSANILITRGAQGLSLFSTTDAPQHIQARLVEVYDAAGAGDTIVGTMTLALAAGASLLEAVIIANHAASEAVKKVGVATVSPQEVMDSFSE